MVSLLRLWPWFSLAWGGAGGGGGGGGAGAGGGGKAVTFLGPPVQTVSITFKPYQLNQDQIIDTLNALNVKCDEYINGRRTATYLQMPVIACYDISFMAFHLIHLI